MVLWGVPKYLFQMEKSLHFLQNKDIDRYGIAEYIMTIDDAVADHTE